LFAPFHGAVEQYRLLEGRWDGPLALAFARLKALLGKPLESKSKGHL